MSVGIARSSESSKPVEFEAWEARTKSKESIALSAEALIKTYAKIKLDGSFKLRRSQSLKAATKYVIINVRVRLAQDACYN